MVEDTVTTEETDELSDEIEDSPSHPYDLPGEWFVLNAQSGHEKKVRTNILTRIKNLHLEDKVYDVVIPTDEVVEIRNGKKVNLEKKTFPGYVLVRMDLDDTTWYEIRNTPSIIGFVGSGADGLKGPAVLSTREWRKLIFSPTHLSGQHHATQAVGCWVDFPRCPCHHSPFHGQTKMQTR